MTVRFFATTNRHYPILAPIDVETWPSRSGLVRSCRAGVQFAMRDASAEERAEAEASPRHVALRWTSLGACLLAERRRGRPWVRHLIQKIRNNPLLRALIEEKLRGARQKAERHEARKRRRAA